MFDSWINVLSVNLYSTPKYEYEIFDTGMRLQRSRTSQNLS